MVRRGSRVQSSSTAPRRSTFGNHVAKWLWPTDKPCITWGYLFLVPGEGFEPPKAKPSDLQSDLVGRLSNPARPAHFSTWKGGSLEPKTGFEPATRCLQNSRSTPELLRHPCSAYPGIYTPVLPTGYFNKLPPNLAVAAVIRGVADRAHYTFTRLGRRTRRRRLEGITNFDSLAFSRSALAGCPACSRAAINSW